MPWFIFYSQTEIEELSSNKVTDLNPLEFLVYLDRNYPETINKIHWAMEISQDEYKAFKNQI